MSHSQVIDLGSSPAAPARRASGATPADDGSDLGTLDLLQPRIRRALADRESALERPPGSRPEAADPAASVLSARQFQSFLERERSLADRGTRRFSLLVLRRRARGPAERAALAQLARQASKRLRSTDLVGQLDAERVEILLTDTEPAGAQVVAAWVEEVGEQLGLDLEPTIYVYPSVTEPGTERRQGGDPHEPGPRGNARSNGRENGRPHRSREGAARTQAITHAQDGEPADRGAAGAGPWPMHDYWPTLAVPTPPWKRLLDVLLSSLALLALFPLFVLIAGAIALDSSGPVIFRQLRAGRGGRPFVFYKFRSMIVGAEEKRAELAAWNEQSGPIFKIYADPRITRVGRILRRWSLDELPQLWNVLKGDISLVGPRSPTLDEVCQYERWQRRRLCVTGGITCTWQVRGRSQIPFCEWVRLDIRYVACRNLWLDLRLLVLTLPAVISGRGAC